MTASDDDFPEGWESLGEYLRRTDSLMVEMLIAAAEVFAEITKRQAMIRRTRRTVEVTARKYRARRKRK